jgi:hypothetical protein
MTKSFEGLKGSYNDALWSVYFDIFKTELNGLTYKIWLELPHWLLNNHKYLKLKHASAI